MTPISSDLFVFETNQDHGETAQRTANPPGRSCLYNPLQRIEQSPVRSINKADASATWKTLLAGIDNHHYGHTLVNVQTGEERKASWPCTVATYNRHERAYRDHDAPYRGKSYSLKFCTQHLAGAATDFFCGVAPSDGGDWQWALLDGDNRCEDFSKLVAIINRHFPELHPEPSTSGRGVHWMVKIGNFHSRYLYKLPDHAMHDKVIDWSGRIKTATAKLVAGSFLELKGACCVWNPAGDGGAGGYLMGTLARMPVTVTADQLRRLPILDQQHFEDRVQQLELLAGISPAPLKSSSSPQGLTTFSPPAAGAGDDPYESDNAFERMVHAKFVYIKRHKALPPDAETLVAFYEALGLATGEATPERLIRAESVLAYARERWQPGMAQNPVCDPEALRKRQEVVSKCITQADIEAVKGKKERSTITPLEIAAYVMIALELNATSQSNRDGSQGFSSRDKIMSVMNQWHEEGQLPHLISKQKMAMLRKLTLAHGLLVLTVAPSRASGTASSYGIPPAPLKSFSSPQG